MRRPGVIASRRTTGVVHTVGGLPVLDPVSTWCALAQVLDVPDLVAVADRIVTTSPRLRALASTRSLEQALGSLGGARGIVALRAALCESREGAWSRPESLLRVAVVRAGLPEPLLNAAVPVGGGRSSAPDLGWPQFKVAVEYDGFWHDTPQQRSADLERHELLADIGWLVVHIRKGDVFPDPLVAVARILRRLTERGYRHSGSIERARMPRFNP